MYKTCILLVYLVLKSGFKVARVLKTTLYVSDLAMPVSAVQDFYKGCGVFVTGATGFLGMGLVEKLLRCCPDSGPIFLLVRPKKGKQVEERLEDVTKNKVLLA
jgi:FlaA1/EpsC-like NDP-sugar epimerase